MISSQTIGSVAVLAGALVGGGVFLLIAFLVGVDVLPSTRAAEGGRLVRTASRRLMAAAAAGLVVLLDAPYPFAPDDGPECFPGRDVRILPERPVVWYGPGMVDARDRIRALLGPRTA